jgi:thiosulfate/3-mercaptopyruvate sulfurtransferase
MNPRFYVLLALLAAVAAHAGDAPPPPAQVVPVPAEPAAPTEYVRRDALVSAAMLLEMFKQKDMKLSLIDARNPDAYDEGHLPGARNIPSDPLQAPDSPPYYMPSNDALKKIFSAAGIDADERIVIYDQDDGRLAARVWFTLHACGHDKVSILDGGVDKWREAKGIWDTQPLENARAGTFEPAATLRGVCALNDLTHYRTRVRALGKLPPTTLLDARSTPEYMGEEVRGKNGGHIPGAANLEWSAFMTGKERSRVWRSPQEIHAILRLAGVEREQKIAVYDQAGGRSAHVFFTLWLMGFDNACNYVAGWREYGNREDVEIEK